MPYGVRESRRTQVVGRTTPRRDQQLHRPQDLPGPRHTGPLIVPPPTFLFGDKVVALGQAPGGHVGAEERAVVLKAIRQHAAHRGWVLHPVHVRSNHVHVVVEANVRPEKVMTQFKGRASRALNRSEWRERRWAYHGSTRYLWETREVEAAVEYVVHQQGPTMAVYVNPARWALKDPESFSGPAGFRRD